MMRPHPSARACKHALTQFTRIADRQTVCPNGKTLTRAPNAHQLGQRAPVPGRFPPRPLPRRRRLCLARRPHLQRQLARRAAPRQGPPQRRRRRPPLRRRLARRQVQRRRPRTPPRRLGIPRTVRRRPAPRRHPGPVRCVAAAAAAAAASAAAAGYRR